MAATDFTTKADVKEFLGVAGNADDSVIDKLIDRASVYLLKYMNRTQLAVTDYQETFDGHGHDRFVPRVEPVQGINSVVSGAVTIPVATGTTGAGWILDEKGNVTLRGYCFEIGRANCVVSYKAGFLIPLGGSVVPSDLAGVCIELVAAKLKRRKRVGETQVALPQSGGTATFTVKDLSDDAREVLEQYALRF